jgi:predicted  nucleic acid-binding Zn-ribbon protein
MNQAQALYRLQTLETQIDTAQKRLLEIESLLQNPRRLAQAKIAYEAQHSQSQKAEGALRDLELESAALAQKITENEALLYSGQIKNPRELQERQKEISSLKARQEKLQADIQQASEALRQEKAHLATCELELVTAQDEALAQEASLKAEDQEQRRHMAKWLKERKAALPEVEEANQKMYKKLKAQKGGLAVVRLDGETCSFCQVEQYQNMIQQIRQGKGLIHCHSCDRILVSL